MGDWYERFLNWLNIEQRSPVFDEHSHDDLIESWRLDSEDLEALHTNLDQAGVPRYAGANEDQEEYSAWGRVLRYTEMVAGKNNEQ